MISYGSVLITGGAGFVGSMLASRILPFADHLYIIDDLTTGNPDSIPISDKVTFYQKSITNEDVLNEVLPKIDIIFHLACRNLVQSMNNIEEDFHINLYGGYFLLKKTLELNPHLKRFVYTSTTSVYNDASILPTPENYYNISLPYAASKFSMEHYCDVFTKSFNLPISILRLSNLYGPGQLSSNPYCGVVAKFFESSLSHSPLIIYGNGTQTRDFTFIDDGIDAILLAGTHPSAIGKVFNVGTGIETNILTLAQAVLKITNNTQGKINYQTERNVDVVKRRLIDSRFIHDELGWKPTFSLDRGLEKTYKWIVSKK
ncbi:NAD-dependent epimerase/dehydratase family protein [Alteribacillus sp. HJP-4]|uniref:NAD-dependent epimerase/dehydratase family protein n=1 Tax=Alteribacillus sp. HJP-4 TaxID=2775394 RepID=UPI0035CCE260